MHRKTLYGYNLNSDLALPYLRDADRETGTAGEINISETDALPDIPELVFENKNLKLGTDSFRLDIPDVADYFISVNKNTFHIKYIPGSEKCPKNIGAFLLGTVMGGILHLHNRLNLHAASVNAEDKTFMVAGESGAGKSSVLAELLKADTRFVCDDVSVIDKVAGEFTIAPGHENIRLWRDAAISSGYSIEEVNQIRPQDDKFWVPMPEKFQPESGKLCSLFILEKKRSSEVKFEKISGPLKIKYLQAFNFRNIFLRLPGRHNAFFQQAAALADAINMYVVTRPDGYYADEIAGTILEEVTGRDLAR